MIKYANLTARNKRFARPMHQIKIKKFNKGGVRCGSGLAGGGLAGFRSLRHSQEKLAS